MNFIYHVYTERYGEVEGMFTEEGNMLGCWCNGDANWRQEYFGPMMEKLGYIVLSWDEESPEYEAAVIQIRDYFGLQYCDQEIDE